MTINLMAKELAVGAAPHARGAVAEAALVFDTFGVELIGRGGDILDLRGADVVSDRDHRAD